MSSGDKSVIRVIAVILLIIFGINKYIESEKENEQIEELREKFQRIDEQKQQYEYQLCSFCNGNGQVLYDGYSVTCQNCNGKGQVVIQKKGRPSFGSSWHPCNYGNGCTCRGFAEDKYFPKICKNCGHKCKVHEDCKK
jgi:hypothetical protein